MQPEVCIHADGLGLDYGINGKTFHTLGLDPSLEGSIDTSPASEPLKRVRNTNISAVFLHLEARMLSF